MDYTKNALGRFVLDSNFNTTGISFITALCANINGINPEFQKIVEKTHKAKLPLLAYYPFDFNYYTQFVFNDESRLPTWEKDIQFQNLINSLKYKTFSAVVIDMSNPFDGNGEPVDPNWIRWGGEMFMKRVKRFFELNKPKTKILLSTNDEIIKKYSPEMPKWIVNYDSFVNQIDKISGSYPTTKPRYYTQYWHFWKYYSNLVLFNGDRFSLNMELGYNSGESIPVEEDKEEVKIKLENIILQLQELKKQL
jgi:hypothetical protein